MQPSNTTQSLDLGRLLRVQAMVTESAQTEATYKAGTALVRTFMGLREEILLIMRGDELEPLRGECNRLFPPMGNPPPFDPATGAETTKYLEAAAGEALLNLRKLGGWIQGLINELTLERRLRLEAEAKVAQASRPPTGFQQP